MKKKAKIKRKGRSKKKANLKKRAPIVFITRARRLEIIQETLENMRLGKLSTSEPSPEKKISKKWVKRFERAFAKEVRRMKRKQKDS